MSKPPFKDCWVTLIFIFFAQKRDIFQMIQMKDFRGPWVWCQMKLQNIRLMKQVWRTLIFLKVGSYLTRKSEFDIPKICGEWFTQVEMCSTFANLCRECLPWTIVDVTNFALQVWTGLKSQFTSCNCLICCVMLKWARHDQSRLSTGHGIDVLV